MNKRQHKKFLKSPEYQQLQLQLMEYETLRKKGFTSENAFLRSSRFLSDDLLFNPLTYHDDVLKDTWKRLCQNDDNNPFWRPQALTGTITNELPQFSMPVLPQKSNADLSKLRNDFLAIARENNWHDYSLLPGAVVHGNVNSTEAKNNTSWTLRGTAQERAQFAQERDFGNNDECIAQDDDWQFFDATFRHMSKNLDRFLLMAGPIAVLGLITLLEKIVEFVLTGGIKYEITTPITQLIPAVRVHAAEDLLFYPYDVDENGVKQYDPQYPRPPWHQEFRNDDVVAHLQTASETPVFDYFKPYKQHQDNFPINNGHFTGVAGFEDDDLDIAMSEGRVYITDFKDFNDEVLAQFNGDDVAPRSGGRFYAAIGLFAVPKNSNQLKTIAIQPTQRPPESEHEWWWWYHLGWGNKANPPSKIITPADDYWTWQMAKNAFVGMYAQSSVVDHLSTHVYLYPIATSFYRQIPEMHPLSAIVLPHLTSIVFNNYVGIFMKVQGNLTNINGSMDADGNFIYGDPYEGLLTGAISDLTGYGSKSFVDGVLRRSKHYDFVKHGQPTDRKQNADFDAIGDYPQHDDNTKTYGAIRRWVRDYIKLYYKNNGDVRNDTELQAFCQDVYGAGVKGFPLRLNNRNQLINMVTRIIYWMSVNHALSNLLAFQPLGAPGFYSNKAMDPNGRRRERDWLEACPRLNVAMGTFEFTRIFVDLPTPWHRSLGKYPQGNFMHDPRVYQYLHTFQDKIKQIDDDIRDVNKSRRWAYDVRLPSTMTLSPWN